jgi:hypothetical protein
LTNQYDVGRRRNWESVFGSNIWLWPLPVFGGMTSDGVIWMKNIFDYENNQMMTVESKNV